MSKEATNASKQEVRKDASDDGWEDERQVDVKEILKNAEITNRLLLALVNHPDFVGNNPPSSPKQLWNAADFCRRTYIEYALPILPQFCFYRSPRFVNRKILNYSRSYVINGGLLKIAEGAPTEEQDRWLEDPENWPDEDENFMEKAQDLWSRNYTLAMTIADKEKELYMYEGIFEYGEEVESIVTEIFGGKEKRESFEKNHAGLKK